MKENTYKKLTKLFSGYELGDLSSVDYYLQMVWEKKLFEALDENGEYKFRYSIAYFDDPSIKDNKRVRKIVAIKGEKEDYNNTDCSYTFKLVLDDNEEVNFYMSDRLLLHEITNSIESDISHKKRLMNSKSIYFENEDIIITDPCYIIKEDDKHNDWSKCEYGENMEKFGIINYITRPTLYGDWGCTTFNSDTKEAIGEFCADAGLVSVFSLDEVRNYNPNIDEWIEKHSWCVTKIKNFTGEVHTEVEHREGIHEEDKSYKCADGSIHTWAHKGEKWEDDNLHVIGKGNINFITRQTSLS